LAHLLLMKRLNCPFASDDPEQTASCSDLFLACLICSRTYEEGLEFFNNIDVKWLKQWDKKLSKWFRKGKLDAIEEFQKFDTYRKTALYVPWYFPMSKESGTASSGAHWSMKLKQFLIRELRYTESEALNMPLAQAIVEYYIGLESAGSIKLMNDFECAVTEGTIKQ
jgi:hypothetical protein